MQIQGCLFAFKVGIGGQDHFGHQSSLQRSISSLILRSSGTDAFSGRKSAVQHMVQAVDIYGYARGPKFLGLLYYADLGPVAGFVAANMANFSFGNIQAN